MIPSPHEGYEAAATSGGAIATASRCREGSKLNDIRIGASHLAPDLPRPSSLALAGPDRAFLPLAGQGIFHGPAVSTAGLTCAAALGRPKVWGGGDFLNFDASASPCLAADDATRDGADALESVGLAHAHEGRSKHVQEVGRLTQGGPRVRAG